MIREIKREMVDYITRETGVNRETVVKVLRAEEKYLLTEIQDALGRVG
ncbi:MULTISPECIES: hypothetical protein [Thermococcus]|uniref:Uncharacterized protein n=1 Tax=Thermococcus camini TaxID=2016373 RepID=A0A7G2D9B1_9EURY|nr:MULTISPECIES: hypothetical protein [Thermococcus]CAD5245097.1 conserved protein of unknown function [Thermococcus camini]